MGKFIIAAYWGARADDVHRCARNMQSMQEQIGAVDPLIAQWLVRSRSKDIGNNPVNISDYDVAVSLLQAGQNRRDVSGEVMDDLGFRVGLWNGRPLASEEASISVHCGCTSDAVGNSVILNLPEYDPQSGWGLQAHRVLQIIAEIWQPEWAGLMSKVAMREREFDADRIFVDWMIYIPRRVDGPICEGVNVKILDNGSSIITVQDAPALGSSMAHMDKVAMVERLIGVV